MKTKRIKALALAALMLCTLLLVCACESNEGPATTTAPAATNPPTTVSKTATYKVHVIGTDGKPASTGIIARFMKDGQQVAIQNVDASGVAAKELDKGNYTVELMFTDSETAYYYDTADLTLSETKTELTIDLAYALSGEPQMLYPQGEEAPAYHVLVGRTQVTLTAGKRTYFLFTPTEPGVYKLYTSGETYVTGYFGGPHFVQEFNAAETVEGNTSTVNVTPSQIGTGNTGTTVLVIGVDNDGASDVQTMLYVDRIGEYINTETPSVIYKTTAALTPWVLPEGSNVSKFDLTAATDSVVLVKDETTGFYHLNSVDGPLVVVCLGSASATYLDYAAPYDTILKNTGVNKYFQDESGNYVKKEVYDQCLQEYIGVYDDATGQYTGGCIDRATGLYPLTDDLMYIIKNNGEYKNWWNSSSAGYLFTDADGYKDLTINPEIAWLFMCCYIA